MKTQDAALQKPLLSKEVNPPHIRALQLGCKVIKKKIIGAGDCLLPLISIFDQILHLYTVSLHTDSVSSMSILHEQAANIFGYKILSSHQPKG